MPGITIRQWRQSMEKLGKEFGPAVRRGLRSGAERGITELHRATEEAPAASANGKPGAFDRGRYKSGWKVEVTNNQARFYNDKPYADVIEEGRRAGRPPPPPDQLVPWVKRKLKVKNQKMAQRVARAVAFVIGKRGLKGRHVLASAEKRIERALAEDIEREIDLLLTGRH